MNKIADYDTYDYDYSTYWSKREYEHNAEVLVLSKLLSKEKGKWFLDIGGSFGRLTDQYFKRFSNPVIVDYSLKTLQKNYANLTKRFPNIELISANAYYLPFKDNCFSGSLMVRVLHHIENQNECFTEIKRVLNNNGIHIQEYANKIHIKAVLRAILSFNFDLFNKEPFQQPDKHNYEGTKEGSKVLFLNYHPSFISTLLRNLGFKIESKYGCSFFRIDLLKRILGVNLLTILENISQRTLSWANISPSIFIKARIEKNGQNNIKAGSIQDILVCPYCKGELKFSNSKAVCTECKKDFTKKENIWDFRI